MHAEIQDTQEGRLGVNWAQNLTLMARLLVWRGIASGGANKDTLLAHLFKWKSRTSIIHSKVRDLGVDRFILWGVSARRNLTRWGSLHLRAVDSPQVGKHRADLWCLPCRFHANPGCFAPMGLLVRCLWAINNNISLSNDGGGWGVCVCVCVNGSVREAGHKVLTGATWFAQSRPF